ncbi:ComF family protein [[Clostridium] fimetarium]|uniref:ComF family protein n=1 Tax=[Clostridium] fimetarium TaxID=99656 RepID=A0A1I0P3L1_9FIRM|nr:ComF family protein [[Clostridium] fimetarium]SEW08759.1 comF family protein [[Clostridium] fimetarium]
MRNKNIYGRELFSQAKKVFYKGVEIIYPSTCPICTQVLDKNIDEKVYICEKCRKKLSYIESPRCLQCGKPVDNAETEFCYDCSRVKHIYSQGVGVWAYTDEIKNSIYQFKYHNKREYGEFYGFELKNRYESIIKNWDADVLIPVPLHKSKQRKRGYNQAEIIAKSIGKLLDIPVDSQLLKREKKTLAQKELNDKERLKNLENAFKIEEKVVKYDKVIIVDDIYTTGTTIDSCAKILIDAGVVKVYYISLCIGKGF